MMMTVALTPEAQGHLERYLKQIKTALRGNASIDAEEVERDVLGHIDTELAAEPQPVAAGSLLRVLDRLGKPDKWVPLEGRPAWRGVFEALRSGPEDWRLAYLTFGLFVAGTVLFMGSIDLWPLPPVFVATSVLFARATLALLDEHNEPVGARRWLIYPALVPIYVVLLAAAIMAPAGGVAGALTDQIWLRDQMTAWLGGPAWLLVPALVALVLGTWWVLVGLVFSQAVSAVRTTFYPFADWLDRRHALRLALAGVLLATVAGAALVAARMRLL